MRISLSIETLQDAYDICILVKDHSANVIAGAEENEDIKSDKEWHEKATRFMNAFDKAIKSKPERIKYRNDWINQIEHSLKKFNTELEKINKQ